MSQDRNIISNGGCLMALLVGCIFWAIVCRWHEFIHMLQSVIPGR